MKSQLSKFTFAGCLIFALVSGRAAASDSAVSVSEFSPAKIPLQWNSGASPEDATYSIYYRKVHDGISTAWEQAAGLQATSATQGYFEGQQGETIEFRSAAFSPSGDEMVVLADFDFVKIGEKEYVASEKNRVFPACSVQGFNRTFFIRNDGARQGNGCYDLSFYSHVQDMSEIPSGAMIGLRFNEKIPVRDWSPYRYLELYYWGDVPDGVDLWIESTKAGIRKPIYQFSQDGDSLKEWHTIVVDLNEMLGEPENRREIQTVAFIKPIHNLDLTEKYCIRLDAIRLWKTRKFARTVIDGTPPTKPANLQYVYESDLLKCTWDPSEEDFSKVAGYSVFFTQDRRKPFPHNIICTTHSITIPFKKPPVYQEYYFMVSACNEAGLWSPISQKGITFMP